MVPHKNRTVTVLRLVPSGAKRVFSSVATGLKVYVDQNSAEPQSGFDGEGAFFPHTMITDGGHVEISIGDRITDDLGRQFDVKGKAVFDSIAGKMHKYVLSQAHD